ncbi:MAG: hypothetical protein ACI9TH_002091 [Kiritimatiellia bacterium]|jgi:hypothetical protein
MRTACELSCVEHDPILFKELRNAIDQGIRNLPILGDQLLPFEPQGLTRLRALQQLDERFIHERLHS